MVTEKKCVICQRQLGSLVGISDHHLVPKQYKGTTTILIHNICHQKIHATFSNDELLHTYHTIEAICNNEEMAKFIKWVSKKDPDFYDKNDDTNQRHKKRKNVK